MGRKLSIDIFQEIPKRQHVRMEHFIKPSSQFRVSLSITLLPATSSVGKHIISHRHIQLAWHTNDLHHGALAGWSYTALALHKPEQLLPKGKSLLLEI